MNRSPIVAAAAGLLAAVWIWAGAAKTGLPGSQGTLGLLEVALGIGLLTPWAWRLLGGVSLLLSVAFATYTLGRTALLPDAGGCGCFGHWEPSLGAHMLLLTGMALASLLLLVRRPRPGWR